MMEQEERAGASIAKIKGGGGYALGILFWIAIWVVAARFVDNTMLLAGPGAVLDALAGFIREPSFWQSVGNSALRIVVTGAISAVAALMLGIFSFKFPLIGKLLAPIVQVMKSAPVACVVVIILVAWGANGAFTTIIAFVAFPPFYVSVQEALKERPQETASALKLLGASRLKVFLACIWPASIPFLASASRTAIALSWRAGVTAELLSLPLGSIGAGVYASKLTLDSAELLVWTISVMVLSWLNEKIVVALLNLSARAGRLALPRRADKAEERDRVPAAEQTEHVGAPATASSAASTTLAALEMRDVCKSYEGAPVIDGLTFRVDPGSRICLMAPTGTGKSTALSILARTCTPDSGHADAPRHIGIVFQQGTLVGNLSARDNVALTASAYYACDEIDAALCQLIPEDALTRCADDLSGGMRRLTEIVRAMLSDGAAIIMDEPFTGLDEQVRRKACSFILDSLNGRPLLLSTHDPDDALLLDAEILEIAATGSRAE